jgi:hypothetical protein
MVYRNYNHCGPALLFGALLLLTHFILTILNNLPNQFCEIEETETERDLVVFPNGTEMTQK